MRSSGAIRDERAGVPEQNGASPIALIIQPASSRCVPTFLQILPVKSPPSASRHVLHRVKQSARATADCPSSGNVMNGASLIHPDFSYHFNPTAVKIFIPRINRKISLPLYADGVFPPPACPGRIYNEKHPGAITLAGLTKKRPGPGKRHPLLLARPAPCVVSLQACGGRGT